MNGSEIAVLIAIIVVIILAVNARRDRSDGRRSGQDVGKMRAEADLEIAKARGWPGPGGPTSGPGGNGVGGFGGFS